MILLGQSWPNPLRGRGAVLTFTSTYKANLGPRAYWEGYMGDSGEWGFPGVGRGHGRGRRSALGRVGAAGLAVRSPEGQGAQRESAGAPRGGLEGRPGGSRREVPRRTLGVGDIGGEAWST